MNRYKLVASGVLVALLALVFSACGSPQTEKFDASQVSCDVVANDLSHAESGLKAAKEKLSEAIADTPGIKTAQELVTKAEQKVNALAERQTDCAKVTKPTATPTPVGLDTGKMAEAFAKEMTKLGFKPGDVSVGKVDWDKNPVDRREGAVGDRITSPKELTEFLNGNSTASKAARAHVQAGLSEAEAKRALNGNNYVPVQYNVDVKYRGNTYITSGGKLGRGGNTTTKKGDVVWVFVTRDYKIVWESSVRADCANPGFTHPPRPAKPVAPGKGGGGPKPPKNPPGSTPECVDIPGNGVYDCGSKPADGNYHTGGASKGQVTAPADAAPKPVETSKPGGRGGSVNDSPTNPPGSETGGQAPGADPPSTETPPPPATGTDGDGDAGSVNPGDEPTDENTGDPGNPF